MLKLQYSESGLFIEQVSGNLQDWLSLRVILTIRAGQELHIQPGQASFLLANDVSTLAELTVVEGLTQQPTIAVSSVDPEMVEVSIDGIWIAEHPEAEEGILIAVVPEPTEALLFRLWQENQTSLSFFA